MWYLRALVEGVLGIEADPTACVCAPVCQKADQFRVRRWFRGARYTITVRRGVAGEMPSRQVNGVAWETELLPLAEPGSEQEVIVTV